MQSPRPLALPLAALLSILLGGASLTTGCAGAADEPAPAADESAPAPPAPESPTPSPLDERDREEEEMPLAEGTPELEDAPAPTSELGGPCGAGAVCAEGLVCVDEICAQ